VWFLVYEITAMQRREVGFSAKFFFFKPIIVVLWVCMAVIPAHTSLTL